MAAIGKVSWFVAAALLAALAFVAAPAEGAGLWNMPTNLRQCLGIGFGPGYHAPLVLQAPVVSKTASQPTIYTLHPPQASHCSAGFCEGMSSLGGYAPVAYETPVHETMQTPMVYGHAGPIPTLAPAQAPISAEPITRPLGEPASPSDLSGSALQPRPEALPLPQH